VIEQIEVPWVGPTMNKIWAGIHWRKRKEIADDAHLAVRAAINGKKRFQGPVTIDYYPFIKGRRYDLTNYALTCKGIEDGLVLCGIIQGDSFKYVRRVTIHPPVSLKSGLSFMRVIIKKEDAE